MKLIHVLFIYIVFMLTLPSCNYQWSVAEKKRDRLDFNRLYAKQSFNKYWGDIHLDTINGLTSVQSDSLKIILSSNSCSWSIVFTSGLLYREIILNTIDNSVKEMYNWNKNDIYIENFKLLPYLGCEPTQRRFKFCANSGNFGPSKETFFFELTNDDADKKTNIMSFIQGARLTFFMKSLYLEI